MTREEKITWMAVWAAKNGFALELEGEVGFGRECVGILSHDTYPDYMWFDDKYKRLDNNGDVWIPENAYHKHHCVAVLGRGEGAEDQLYQWLRWFDEQGFKKETGSTGKTDMVSMIFGQHMYHRLVRPAKDKPKAKAKKKAKAKG
jgi:hypothetical protein